MNGEFTPQQCKNYWSNNAWAKYKAVRHREKHTGGGDGDADRMEPNSNADSEDIFNTPAQRKEAKRKRAQQRKNEFSQAVLDEFEQSEMYRLIDEVYVLSPL